MSLGLGAGLASQHVDPLKQVWGSLAHPGPESVTIALALFKYAETLHHNRQCTLCPTPPVGQVEAQALGPTLVHGQSLEPNSNKPQPWLRRCTHRLQPACQGPGPGLVQSCWCLNISFKLNSDQGCRLHITKEVINLIAQLFEDSIRPPDPLA